MDQHVGMVALVLGGHGHSLDEGEGVHEVGAAELLYEPPFAQLPARQLAQAGRDLVRAEQGSGGHAMQSSRGTIASDQQGRTRAA